MSLILITAAVLLVADCFLKKQIPVLKASGKLPLLLVGGQVRIGFVKNKGLLLGKGKKHPLLVILLPTCVVVLSFCLLPYARLAPTLARLGYGMVVGGGASNLTDRIRQGFVTDYLNFPRIKRLRNLYFNLSDFGILIGMLLFYFFY